jgi:ferredoxin
MGVTHALARGEDTLLSFVSLSPCEEKKYILQREREMERAPAKEQDARDCHHCIVCRFVCHFAAAHTLSHTHIQQSRRPQYMHIFMIVHPAAGHDGGCSAGAALCCVITSTSRLQEQYTLLLHFAV